MSESLEEHVFPLYKINCYGIVWHFKMWMLKQLKEIYPVTSLNEYEITKQKHEEMKHT